LKIGNGTQSLELENVQAWKPSTLKNFEKEKFINLNLGTTHYKRKLP
jgi:hypothetical protein